MVRLKPKAFEKRYLEKKQSQFHYGSIKTYLIARPLLR
ncbi:Hypothetical protein IALB_1221 [Ignavibacterium album JCM 16511]|uniref:Uncharacterized protein n=1 Tax=Ignavibacterium album (strain DSM 19864 / JCM 16511 / NBRC 101810 / Mat9-16) TaxID=945713 RepID=I0AIX5_IGNAJ|nr:Hypothetical protein IALB_1221 [Ignavibacterium album JCM 16511]